MDDPDGQSTGLAPITLAEQEPFSKLFAALKQPLSDYSFACTYIWSASLKLSWARLDRHLCVFANGTGDLTMLVPPLPEPGATESDLRDCLGRCFEIMDRYNAAHGVRWASRIEYISDELLERINAATTRGTLNLGAAPMSGDYVYDTARMIDLAGGALKSKRHARSKFLRLYPDCRTQAYEPARHLAGCRQLLALWQRHGDQTHVGEVNESQVGGQVLRRCDSLATGLALQTAQTLGLRGLVLFVGQRLVGFTLGEPLSPTQASILIEKTHPDYPGAAQYIFSEFCRQCWAPYPETNVGDDWGLATLRFTKQSYRPIRLLSKYVVSRQDQPVIVGYEAPRRTKAQVERAGMAQAAAPNAIPTRQDQDKPRLRLAALDDLPAILEIEEQAFAYPQERFGRRQVRDLMANPRAHLLVACVGPKVVAWSATLLRQDRAGTSGRLYALAVHPHWQGGGIGTQLLEEALAWLRQRGARGVFLEVRVGNRAAGKLYENAGFHRCHFLTDYYGPGIHGWRMLKRLQAGTPTAAVGSCSQ